MIVTRFAPSPTGLLHKGHAYSALLNHDLARASGGRFLLRIEDTDQGRCRPEFVQAIFEDLAWLGIAWDAEPWNQSERFDVYREALETLRAKGLLYRCFKTRSELRALANAPHGPSPAPPATAPLPAAEEEALLAEGKPFAWRLDAGEVRRQLAGQSLTWTEINEDTSVTHAVDLSQLDDEVLARKDFPGSYHLASVVDDAAQGVTLVYRGEDLRGAAPLHRVLQRLLDLPEPDYRHHPLITDETGRRLAKRDLAATLRSLRDSGLSAQTVKQQLNA
ncbi:MAG: tRNA glutamyl-Q(34) synthetase GluQRS [Parvularculaceae bacterium]|nr:tRNA glutamyl-Q(34) synthetase GluQRS [Parvularculaceae bacterium]